MCRLATTALAILLHNLLRRRYFDRKLPAAPGTSRMPAAGVRNWLFGLLCVLPAMRSAA
jgi:hypothetical protein